MTLNIIQSSVILSISYYDCHIQALHAVLSVVMLNVVKLSVVAPF